MKAKIRDEHIKLYNFFMISIYILFLPLVIIMKVFEFLGMIGEKIEDFLIKIRINIIEFIFDKFISGD